MSADLPAAATLSRLDLKTLRLFAAICAEGTLNGAARRAAIAPSAVSKRLAELEHALGCTLLTREPRGMRLTPAGETLLHHTRRMLASAEQIALELAEHARGVRGFVRVLANLSAIVEFLPEDLQAFLAAQAGIRVSIEERPSGGVVAGVEEELADLGLCADNTDTRSLTAYPYRSDRLVLVMPAGHPLSRRGAVALADTLDYDHVGLHAESSIYAALRDEARRLGRPLRLARPELRRHLPDGAGRPGSRDRPGTCLRPARTADAARRGAAHRSLGGAHAAPRGPARTGIPGGDAPLGPSPGRRALSLRSPLANAR